MTDPNTPSLPGLRDECATCGHTRVRHQSDQPDGHGSTPCARRADCACGGVFVEISYATRMARFVEAAQNVAGAMAGVRTAMTEASRAFHGLHTAMQHAGLLPEDETGLCDGCDRTDQPVTATDDGRAQLCGDCQTNARNPQYRSALQQLATTFHHVDCDGTDRTVGGVCGGACTQGRSAVDIEERQSPVPSHQHGPQFIPDPTSTWQPDAHALTLDATQLAAALDIPPAAITGPSPDGQPDHWTGAAPFDPARPSQSCPTCWPRACDPSRSECRRRPDAAAPARSDEEATLDGATD